MLTSLGSLFQSEHEGPVTREKIGSPEKSEKYRTSQASRNPKKSGLLPFPDPNWSMMLQLRDPLRKWHFGLSIDKDRAHREEALAMTPDHRAVRARFTDSSIVIDLQDGRSLSVPLDWFPKLRDASPEQQADHRLIGNGIGIHWESLGIDLSTQGLLLDSHPTPDGETTRPKRVSYHVVPTGDEWHLKRQGEDHFISFETKTAAIRAGVREARSHEASQLIIHKKNGRFQEERTYGFDPPGRAG